MIDMSKISAIKKHIGYTTVFATLGNVNQIFCEDTEKNDKVKEYKFKYTTLGVESYIKGNLNSKTILNEKKNAIPLDTYGFIKLDSKFDFNNNTSNIYKKFEISGSLGAKIPTYVGAFMKYKKNFANYWTNTFDVNLIAKYYFHEFKNIGKYDTSLKLGFHLGYFDSLLKLSYANDPYSPDEIKDIGIIFEVDGENANVTDGIKKFTGQFGVLFGTDFGKMIQNIKAEVLEEKPTDKTQPIFNAPQLFFYNNHAGSGLAFGIPALYFMFKEESEYTIDTLKFLIDPFQALLIDNKRNKRLFKWGIINEIEYKGKYKFLKKITSTEFVGIHEHLSSHFMSSFINAFDSKEKMIRKPIPQDKDNMAKYLLARPFTAGINITLPFSFESYIKNNNDLIKNLDVNLSITVEKIWAIEEYSHNASGIYGISLMTNYKSIYSKISINPSIVFGKTNKPKFATIEDLKVNALNMDFIFMPIISQSFSGINYSTMNLDIKDNKFIFKVTLASGEYAIKKYGLDFKASICNLEIANKKLDWKKLLTAEVKFNIFKFINNKSK